MVRRPAAGTWTITDDGAVPIRRVREAVGLPDPSVSARVTGRGRSRTLHWRLRALAGQRVRLIEVGKDMHKVVASTSAARGQVRFRPADGPAGRRAIVALVEQNKLLRKAIAAGSYVAPARQRPTRPRKLRVARRGSRLVASCGRRGPASVTPFTSSSRTGASSCASPEAPARSVTLSGVAPRYGATVTVAGLTNANGRGPSARASSRTVRPPVQQRGVEDDHRVVSTAKGSFSVARGGRSVAGLRVTPGAGAGATCGTAELRVSGRLRSPVAPAPGRRSGSSGAAHPGPWTASPPAA